MYLVFYVYAYLRKSDNTPYYIGKGKGRRAYAKEHTVKVPVDKSRIVFLETNLSDVGACAIERRMIEWYGRKDLNNGILRNRTDGGEGTSGRIMSAEARAKIGAASRNMPKEMRDKIREANRNKIVSEETKERLKSNHRGFTGRTHSAESIEKYTTTRRRNGGYIVSEQERLRLKENRKNQAEQFNIKVSISGINYASIKDAISSTGFTREYIKYRLDREKFPDFTYL